MHARLIVVSTLSLLMLAGCDNKPKQPAPGKPGQQVATAGNPDQTAPSGAAPATCAAAPGNAAIQTAIKAAMADTYGTDETGGEFQVTAVKPTDCQHLSIIYHAKGNANAPQTTSALLGDDGQWVLLFYNKHYPIH